MKIEDVLVELKEKVTIILVTNLVQQAHRLADHVAFLNNSKLVEVGTCKHMFSETPRERSPSTTCGALRMNEPLAVRRPSISAHDLCLWYGDFQA
jgi:ABC-type phosphate transport system ATPase subunit